MSTKITTIVANFETQLASTISVASTTGTLKAPVLDKDGVTLPNSKYVMCFDLGKSNEEHLIFDLNSTTGAMTNIYSISRQGVETSGAQKQHRTGAKVSLTNFANLYYLSKVLNGQIAIDGSSPLYYDATPTFSSANQLVTKGYVDGIAIAGSPNASTTTKGISKLTTHNILQGNFDFENTPRWSVPQTGTGYMDGTKTGNKYNKQYGWTAYSTNTSSGYVKFDEIMGSNDPNFNNAPAWNYGNGASISAGKVNVTNGNNFLQQEGVLTIGKRYYFKFKYTMTAGYRLRLSDRTGGINGTSNANYWVSDALLSSGECYGSFIANSGSFCLEASDSLFSGTIDDFYVFEGMCMKMFNGGAGHYNESQSVSPRENSADYVGYFQPTIAVKPSTTYNYSTRIKTNVISGAGNSAGATVSIIETTDTTGAGQQTNIGSVNTTTGWTTYTGTFTTTANTKFLHVTLLNYGHTGSGMSIESWFDDIVVTEVATNPVSTADNDLRLPTQDQKEAMQGTDGMPSRNNKFLTEENMPMPIGGIIPYAGSILPSYKWAFCDGSAVSRDDYAYLFAVIGTTYGAGDGSTTFNLPNLKTRVPVGKDTSDSAFITLGQTGGAKTHTLIASEMPSHTHSMSNTIYPNGGGPLEFVGGNSAQFPTVNTTGSAGSDQPHNNLQPYLVINYIIKAK